MRRLGSTTNATNRVPNAANAANSMSLPPVVVCLLWLGNLCADIPGLGELGGVEPGVFVALGDTQPDAALDEPEDDRRGDPGPGHHGPDRDQLGHEGVGATGDQTGDFEV